MPAYLMAQVRITDEGRWPPYRAAVGPCAEKFGGRFIVRHAKIEVLEGAHDGRELVILEFPSMAAIHEFWASSDYVGIKALRAGAADVDAWAVPGV